MAYTNLLNTFSYKRQCLWNEFNALGINAKLHYDALNIPIFSAYMSADQSLNTTLAKLKFDTEDVDNNSNYDTALYRFTPTVAGMYFCMLTAYINLSAGSKGANVAIAFNTFVQNDSAKSYPVGTTGGTFMMHTTAICVCNGATDYIEAFAKDLANVSIAKGDQTSCYFQGFRIPTTL